ncbi:DUF4178 domain-containing protein [Synechococcus sp. CBW1107]|uniref:DUF4178 domain-containing protein n=1 Tax=Synechococcus sp. CBW1107 TaxID=2789857 RepID=UPI002AD4D748|nr:DUF4178 domain-containing protein [Synechococcus sp. CBW1107]CAK6691289.1 hypothetical protein ICNINCKA_00981 [Synechococcus sp. CBW1107]
MGVWVLLVLLLVAAWALRQLQKRRRRPAALPQERTLFDLRTGDIVQADGRDWVVEDRLLYDEEGFQWLEYLLRDGSEGRWLCVCEDDWLEVSWLERGPAELARQLDRQPLPFPGTITWEGVTYRLKEQGRAAVSSTSRTMNRRLSGCRFGDYEGPDGLVLSLERWDGGSPGSRPPAPGSELEPTENEAEVTLGRQLDPASLVLLPGDGRSVYRPLSPGG